MLKDYIYGGRCFQFEDKDVPEGAVPVSDVKAKAVEVPKNKEATPTNKSKKVAKK